MLDENFSALAVFLPPDPNHHGRSHDVERELAFMAGEFFHPCLTVFFVVVFRSADANSPVVSGTAKSEDSRIYYPAG